MSDELYCNLNGRVQACTQTSFSSAADAFRLRYGIYETYLYAKGRLEYPDLHWERLQNGLCLLDFAIPPHFSAAYFATQVAMLIECKPIGNPGRVRIQVFTEDTSAPYTPQFLIEAFPLEKAVTEWLENGIRIGLLDHFQKEISPLANCKISHNTHFVPASSLMQEQDLDDVLLYNTEGRIVESAMANLFWIKDGVVATPPLSEGCLAGTIRTVIITCLQEHHVPFTEKVCTLEMLRDADEIFLCNSIRKIRWVREMEGRYYGNKLTARIYPLLPVQAL